MSLLQWMEVKGILEGEVFQVSDQHVEVEKGWGGRGCGLAAFLPYVQLVRPLAEWQNGRMAEWQIGRMEECQSGIML